MPTFAAIDIGSNSVRLKIARLKGSRLEPIHEDREVTRLGESVFKAGFLSPEAMAETIKVLRRFHRAAQRLAADVVRVVATSALRDARNSQAFLEWVRSATGWKVEIISGLEEARLIHLGLTSMGRVGASPVLMIDLGGGSCELTISKEGHIRDTVSLPLGAVRLTNEFLRHDPPRKSELKRLRRFVEREVSRVAGRVVAARVKVVVATSGTAAALAAVANHLQKNSGTRPAGSVSRPVMKRIAKLICRLPIEQRRKLEGIGPRRAEIIAAGVQVYEELLELCHLHGFRYSPLGLRDGLLAQMAADSDHGTRSGKQIESERWDSITNAASARVGNAVVQGAETSPPPAAGVRGMAFGSRDVVRSWRLRKSERTPPAHLLHYFQLGNSGIYAGPEENHRLDRTLLGQVATSSRDRAIESVESGRSTVGAQSFAVVATGPCAQPGA